jgi:hypothetical protein
MFMEKPSCIKELKRLASSLTDTSVIDTTDSMTMICISKVKEVVNSDDLSAIQKIIKLKEICKEHGK